MLHKPKISTLKHLHSILRYFMHSIPIGSIVALLTLTIICINPSPHTNTYALEGTNVRDTISTNEVNNSNANNNNNDLATVEREDSPVVEANTVSDSEPMPLADGDTTASLQILTGQLEETTTAGAGAGPAYRSHNISYNVQNPTDYTLRVSYVTGKTALEYYGINGTAVVAGGTTITGAGNGVKANSMPNNSWGFAWSDNTSTADDAMDYYTMPTGNGGTGLAGGVLKSGTTNVSGTGKLTFAAKFADDAVAGHYKTQVLLSLAATPQATLYQVTYDCNGGTGCPANLNQESNTLSYTYTIPKIELTKMGYKFLGYSNSDTASVGNYTPGQKITLTSTNPNLKLYAIWKAVDGFGNDSNHITKMQDMTSDICNSTSIGTTGQLYDSRDDNVYDIKKISDGKCWMAQNLKLDLNGRTLTTADSNVKSDWISTTGPSRKWQFTSCGTNQWDGCNVTYFYNGRYSEDDQKYKLEYGYYYTWGAATAGQASSFTNGGGDATQDICPKGWKLPTKTQYDDLLSKKNQWKP